MHALIRRAVTRHHRQGDREIGVRKLVCLFSVEFSKALKVWGYGWTGGE